MDAVERIARWCDEDREWKYLVLLDSVRNGNNFWPEWLPSRHIVQRAIDQGHLTIDLTEYMHLTPEGTDYLLSVPEQGPDRALFVAVEGK